MFIVVSHAIAICPSEAKLAFSRDLLIIFARFIQTTQLHTKTQAYVRFETTEGALALAAKSFSIKDVGTTAALLEGEK